MNNLWPLIMLALVACGDKSEDTAEDTAESTEAADTAEN
tara:strand:+ start:421 stop:537 length:117 start_codon:yes stop_codon:yes gene_type:complete